MREGSRLVLQLLADGRISVDEAHDLLAALNGGAGSATETTARPQSEPSATSGIWDQLGGMFSPADLLSLLLQGLSSERPQRRGANFD